MSLGILEMLKQKGIQAEVSSGLSLGEYTALIHSQAIALEEGIKLVQKRGEYMQELVPEGNWLMAAILGMTEEQVQEVCNKVTKGFVVPANFNTIRTNCYFRRTRSSRASTRNCKRIRCQKGKYNKNSRTRSYRKINKGITSIKKRIRNRTHS